jgi:hypothetical protein
MQEMAAIDDNSLSHSPASCDIVSGIAIAAMRKDKQLRCKTDEPDHRTDPLRNP